MSATLVPQSSDDVILFCCTQSIGLLNTSLALAGELTRRGYREVWFATDDNRAEEVARTGAKFVPMGPVESSMAPERWDEDTYRVVTSGSRIAAHRARLRVAINGEHERTRIANLKKLVDEIKPSLMVLNNLAFYGLQVAEMKKIPYVVVAPFLVGDVCHEHVRKDYPAPLSGLPRDRSFRQKIAHAWFKFRAKTVFFDKEIVRRSVEYQKLVTSEGVPKKSLYANVLVKNAKKIICCTVPELDYPFEPPANLRAVGNLVPPLPESSQDTELMSWISSRKSIVYIAFGTITRLSRADVANIVEVARRLGDSHSVLWKLPKSQQALLPPDLPRNLRVESWLDSQYDVLAQENVKIFFNHGGSNSFHEGLYFGKPLLVRPLWLDCYDHAVRAVDFGAGLSVPGDEPINPSEVVDKLRRLLHEPQFAERARYFAELQMKAGGLGTAADVVEETLEELQR